MPEPALHTAEDATSKELWRTSWRLLGMLAVLALLMVPLIRELPLGQSTRTGILAWLLVILGFYWLYAGMGYRPLLIVQLLLFSSAAALLTIKLLLVAADVHHLTVLRRVARVLILTGAACAVANAAGMLVLIVQRRVGLAPPGASK